MTSFLPFIVVGLTAGSIYGLTGTGLVLTYKTSGIFNFAHGAVAAAAAYIFYQLHFDMGWSWPLALIVSVAVFGTITGFVLERLARGLATAAPAMKIVATVGLLIAIQSLLIARYGAVARLFPPYLPTRSFRLGGANVGIDQLIVMLIGAGAAGGLYVFFRSTRLGIAMRGVVDNSDLLGLTGTAPVMVRRWAWVIGSVFAALSGVLLAPTLGLDSVLLTLLVVQAFGAAAIGRFSSIPMTYAGGLFIGVAAALSTKYVASVPALSGLPPSIPFIVLFVALVVARKKLMEPPTQARLHVKVRREPAHALRWGGPLVFAVLALFVPALVGARLPVYTNALIQLIVFLSLSLLVRTSGQVSLCQAGFAAVGAATFSHLAASAGAPWFLAVLMGGLVAIPVGALIAIPAIRLSGLYLALATFGFGILLERLAYRTATMFGSGVEVAAPRPSFATSDAGYYYVVLGFAAAAIGLSVAVRRARLGRLLRAMGDSPVALGTLGVNVSVTKVLVFCISAFMAGVAGALLGPLTGSINGSPFAAIQSLTYLTVLAIAGAGEVRSAIVAAIALAVVPTYFQNATVIDYLPVLFGVSAIGAALASAAAASGHLSSRIRAYALDRLTNSSVRERLADATRTVEATP